MRTAPCDSGLSAGVQRESDEGGVRSVEVQRPRVKRRQRNAPDIWSMDVADDVIGDVTVARRRVNNGQRDDWRPPTAQHTELTQGVDSNEKTNWRAQPKSGRPHCHPC